MQVTFAAFSRARNSALGAAAVGWKRLVVQLPVKTGGVVSTTLMVSTQVAVLLQQSLACHVRVMIWLQSLMRLVTVFNGTMVTLVQQLSVAVGVSNVQSVPHSTVRFLPQQQETTS